MQEQIESSSTQKKSKGKSIGGSGVLSNQLPPLLLLLLVPFFSLVTISLVNLYSASLGGHEFYSQLKHLFIAIFFFALFGWFIPIRWHAQNAYVYFVVVSLLLLLVLFTGKIAGGSQRWLQIGPLRGQPSELAKIVMAIVTATFLTRNRVSYSYKLVDLWPLLTMYLINFILIFEQPSLGGAGLCLITVMIQLCFVRLNLKSLLIVGASFLILVVLGWEVLLHDYQKTRVLSLLDPSSDPHGSSYNSLQSLIAIGSGKLLGKGFMSGTQTQLQFLPARKTDFIFSVIAEEHGFLGGILIFILLTCIVYIGLEIARHCKDSFSALLAIGLVAQIFTAFVINIAMVLGMFPVVGMPLPLMSHGGSSLIGTSIAIGLLVAIFRENRDRYSRVTQLQTAGWKAPSIKTPN